MKTNQLRTINLLTCLIIFHLIINYWDLTQARRSTSSRNTIVKHNTIHKTIHTHSYRQPARIPQHNQQQQIPKQYNSTYNYLQNIQPLYTIKRQIKGDKIREESQSFDRYPTLHEPYKRLNNYQQYNNYLNEQVPIDEQVGYLLPLGD
ncbi:unnamed protein product [Schistosoma spindalis]|nr:unnamed protein product [Schistosoma spindale]